MNFHLEIEFLRNFFRKNGFSSEIFYKHVRGFLNRKYNSKERKIGPTKLTMHFRFPFITNKINRALNKEIKDIFESFLPQISPKFAIYNNFKINSFFKNKDKLPDGLCMSTVYLFQCPCCQHGYIGSSLTNLSLRVDQHRGVSSRTKRSLERPTNSSVRNHCENSCNVNFSLNDFTILSRVSSNLELRIQESIFIKIKKPRLNIDSSAHPLYIF